MHFIGDVHGNFRAYQDLIDHLDCSIQVGDMGIGFENHLYPYEWNSNHKFIRGNHANPDACRKHPNYLGDFGFMYEQSIFYISGAWSIDYQHRTLGCDFWKDEELSYYDFSKIFDVIYQYKPRVIVSHDCPNTMRKELFGFDKFVDTKTGMALDTLFEIWQPVWWIFGHYHRSRRKN